MVHQTSFILVVTKKIMMVKPYVCMMFNKNNNMSNSVMICENISQLYLICLCLKLLMGHPKYLYYLHFSHHVYQNKGEGALITS